ncbi:DUF6965 family protein [Tenuifilum osseticum]|uniref:DUF6965 family protein n=1 Tax=Tenuifilum osseticum TaxID=3374723 RepID=UPI0034E3F0D3
MNTEHRYTLEKGSKKHYCPNCNKKTFVRYIDRKTGDYLPEKYGRCDRESKCSYHLNPYLDGYAKMIWEQEQKVTGVTKVTVQKQNIFHTQPIPQPIPEPVFFDFETFKQTLQPERYEKNTFIQNLFYKVQFPFDVEDVTKVIQLYRLGTVASGYRAGAITFPFIDIKGNVRAVQVKQFDEQNHTTGTDFLHSIIERHYARSNKPLPEWLKAYTKQDKIITCLFGEHLLSKYHSNPVALVEAPKTAVYGTLYFGLPETPESLVWLAVYNKSSFSFDKLKVLQGRFVYVFPDLSNDGSTFKEWETKAKEYESRLHGTRFIFSNLLEQLVQDQEKAKGYDIADYLIKLDWRQFRKYKDHKQETPPKDELNKPNLDNLDTIKGNSIQTQFQTRTEPYKQMVNKSKSWSVEINELEDYFSKIELPKTPIKLNEFTTILNCELFIESHINTIKKHKGNNTFLPYLERLKQFKQLLLSAN